VTGVRLEITINDGGLGAAMRRAIAAASNLGPALEASGELMVTSFTVRFDKEVGPGGVPWVPSKAALGLVPRASGRRNPGKTMTDTGALRASIDKSVSANQVEIGTTRTAAGDVNRKAAALQFGVAGINLPARPYVGFDDQDTANLEDLWTDVVREAFDGA